jgi:hypothetical protein
MNKFINIIQNIALPCKYTNWYISIITNALSKNRITYTENHHIVPKSFAKELSIIDIHSVDNIVALSAKEHFICHRLLAKIFTGNLKRKMSYAIHRLAYSDNGNKDEIYMTSQHYEYLRKQHSLNLTGEGNPMYGKTHSDETKLKMSARAIGRKVSDETRIKFCIARKGEGNPMFGKSHTLSAKEKISVARKGKYTGEQNVFYGKTHTVEMKKHLSEVKKAQLKSPCPHCSKIIDPSNFKRWHGDNCKFKI